MSVSTLAAAAITWLIKAYRSYRKRRTEINMVIAAVKSLGFGTKQLEKLTDLLAKAEKTVGARTNAWRRIANAAKNKSEVTLSVDDVKYLNVFKKIFDRTIKKPFKR